jgi:hypothetical protein
LHFFLRVSKDYAQLVLVPVEVLAMPLLKMFISGFSSGWTWGSSVSIVSDYRLDDWVTGVSFPAEEKDFL